MPYPALVVDADDTILTANPAAESFGGDLDAADGGQAARQVSRRWTARCSTWCARPRKSGVSVAQYDVIVGWSDQPPQSQNIHAAPLQDGDGEVLLLMHPQGMADKMDRSLGHRSAARSVTGMAAMLAHEIRNPLAGISGAAQLLEMGLGDADRELTGLIQAEAARIGKLVDRVEAVRRPASGAAAAAEHPRRAGPGAAGGQGRASRRTRASPRTSTRRCRRPPATPTSCCRCSRTC